MEKDPVPIPKNSQNKKGAGNLSVKSSNHQPVVWRAQKKAQYRPAFSFAAPRQAVSESSATTTFSKRPF